MGFGSAGKVDTAHDDWVDRFPHDATIQARAGGKSQFTHEYLLKIAEQAGVDPQKLLIDGKTREARRTATAVDTRTRERMRDFSRLAAQQRKVNYLVDGTAYVIVNQRMTPDSPIPKFDILTNKGDQLTITGEQYEEIQLRNQ